MHPAGLTLCDLYWMAIGKAEFLGATGSGADSVMAYNPSTLASWAS